MAMREYIDWIGTALIGYQILQFCIIIWLWIKGILPVWWRLGLGLSKREIAIFGDDTSYNSLKTLLIDSKIFREKNIIHIRQENIEKSKNKTIFLVDWESYAEKIDKVFDARRSHQVPIVIYAKPGTIPNDKMNDIANKTLTVVSNFRGRLLNDILTSLITTSYDRN